MCAVEIYRKRCGKRRKCSYFLLLQKQSTSFEPYMKVISMVVCKYLDFRKTKNFQYDRVELPSSSLPHLPLYCNGVLYVCLVSFVSTHHQLILLKLVFRVFSVFLSLILFDVLNPLPDDKF